MKVAKVIEKCNSEKLWSLWEFEEEFPDLKLVASDLNVERDRWFEISTNVYECEDGFVGVSGISQVYSEIMSYSDCECPCSACEYEAIPSITYQPKKSTEKMN